MNDTPNPNRVGLDKLAEDIAAMKAEMEKDAQIEREETARRIEALNELVAESEKMGLYECPTAVATIRVLAQMDNDVLERHSGTTHHREWANSASVWLYPGDWIAVHSAEDAAAIEAAKRLIP